MSMPNPTRERDLVLAPNEYAYISDQTKGHIVAYVGPFKTSMANTDQPVFFEEQTKRFNICNLDDAIKTFTTVPEGWYVMLKNPPKDGKQPTPGTANNLPNLEVGRKVNLPGPLFFSLWPGQMVRVIKGHRLRSNQYLVVRVYEEEKARLNWRNAVIKPQNPSDDKPLETLAENQAPDLSVGKLLVIKGSEVSFYIPPTGLEVVPDEKGNYVRDAVTLEKLEYCILLDENGNKRYIKGPDVVIPNPTEAFFTNDGMRKFRAIELSEISGIYVKVISPYEEGGVQYKVGQELFITGKEQMIYFPQQEHALIKYGEHEIYQAVAIPPGEGRYFLNRKTGLISLKKGPAMFLPDPREAVIVQRILTPNQCDLWYPGNKAVKDYNVMLNNLASLEKSEAFLTKGQVEKYAAPAPGGAAERKAKPYIAGEEFVREQSFMTARTITLDTKFQGAVTVDVWTGYAILVTSKTGSRKVVVGPQTCLLEYDETLSYMELSTGTPKTDERLIRTVFMRVLHNKVSDMVTVETKDLCPASVHLSYRVNFEGEPEKWFNVENYVKFLTDHMRSVIRNAVKKLSVLEFYTEGMDILRDIILGKADEQGKRNRGLFSENGMRIYDVEIFNIKIQDAAVEKMLFEAEHGSVRRRVEVESTRNTQVYTSQIEVLNRQIEEERNNSELQKLELERTRIQKQLEVELDKQRKIDQTAKAKLDSELVREGLLNQIADSELSREKASEEQSIALAALRMAQELERLKAEVDAVSQKAQAFSPDLIAALQAFGDKALAEKMASAMAPLSILGGKSVAEVFSNMLRGTVLEGVLKPMSGGQASEN